MQEDEKNDGPQDEVILVATPKANRRTVFSRLSLYSIKSDWLLAIFTLLLCFISILQWCTLEKTDKTLNLQISVTEDDRRPWIRPDFQLVDFNFDNALRAEITILSNYMNIGKSPARNIHMRFGATVLTKDNIFDSAKDESAQCELAQRDAENDRYSGIVLFPNQSAPRIINGFGLGKAYVEAPEYQKAWPSPDKLGFRIFGCIFYAYGVNLRYNGHSGFSYNIQRKLPSNPDLTTFFAPTVGNVPINEINFQAFPFSSGTVD